MRVKYIDECKQIQQNCTYTAEAHHQMALRYKTTRLWLQIIPAIVAAVSGTLVAAGVSPQSLLWLTVLSATVSAVANIIDPNKNYQAHLDAAKNFTVLKHDSRALHESFGSRMNDDAFAVAVENLHDKYNELVKMVPPTSKGSFQQARTTIQEGIHSPDKSSDGQIQ
jgi:hypothetical protein